MMETRLYETGNKKLDDSYVINSDVVRIDGDVQAMTQPIPIGYYDRMCVFLNFNHYTLGADSKAKWKIQFSFDGVTFYDFTENGTTSPHQQSAREYITELLTKSESTVQMSEAIDVTFDYIRILAVETNTGGTPLDQGTDHGTFSVDIRLSRKEGNM